MSKISTKDFMLRTVQIAARSNTGDTSIHFTERKLPDKKTLSNYQIALEEAVSYMFVSGGSDVEYIERIFREALDRKKLGEKMGNFQYKDFKIKETKVEVAILSANKANLHIQLRFENSTVKITTTDVNIRGKKKPLRELQDTFNKFQNLLKFIDTSFKEIK